MLAWVQLKTANISRRETVLLLGSFGSGPASIPQHVAAIFPEAFNAIRQAGLPMDELLMSTAIAGFVDLQMANARMKNPSEKDENLNLSCTICQNNSLVQFEVGDPLHLLSILEPTVEQLENQTVDHIFLGTTTDSLPDICLRSTTIFATENLVKYVFLYELRNLLCCQE